MSAKKKKGLTFLKKFKKLTALFIAVLMIFATFSVFAQASITKEVSPRSITIASAIYRDFYDYSGPNTITLSQGCDFISFKVNCASGSDEMIAIITDHSHGGAYNMVLSFPGDGSTTTFETYFGSGHYTITLLGNDKLHTLGLVAFST